MGEKIDMTDRKWHFSRGLGELSLCKIRPYQATQWWEDVTCPVCLGMRPTVDNTLLQDLEAIKKESEDRLDQSDDER